MKKHIIRHIFLKAYRPAKNLKKNRTSRGGIPLLFLMGFIVVLLFGSCGNNTSSGIVYTVSGFVTGLDGTLILQNNGGDDITVSTDGVFTFSNALADGESYEVTIKNQPAGQTGFITNGTGTISGADVTDVAVHCYDSGTLDPSFGVNGVVTYDNGGSQDSGYDVVTDAQGRILVAGNTTQSSNSNIMLLRFTTDGILDTGFGTGGKAAYDSGDNDYVTAMHIDSQGRILVTGNIFKGTKHQVIILRFSSHGALDSTFGTGGVVTYSISGSYGDYGNSIALDAQGNIFVTGHSYYEMNSARLIILKYEENGSLDSTFGTDGVVTYENGYTNDRGNSIITDNQGNILVTGYSNNSNDDIDALILKYSNNGIQDTSFGTGGIARYGGSDDEYGQAIITDTQGRLLIAGYNEGSDVDLFVLRYSSEGVLDTSFGTGGTALYPAQPATAGFSIKQGASGKLFTAGLIQNGSYFDVLIVSFNSDGNMNTGFGTDGAVTYHVENGFSDYSMTLDGNGEIVYTGTSNNGNDNDILLLRYIP